MSVQNVKTGMQGFLSVCPVSSSLEELQSVSFSCQMSNMFLTQDSFQPGWVEMTQSNKNACEHKQIYTQ